MVITLLAADSLHFQPFWSVIGLIFVVERVVTVWAAGWRGRLIALPLVIEIGYDLVLQAVYVKSLFDIATGRTAGGTTSRERRKRDEPQARSRTACPRTPLRGAEPGRLPRERPPRFLPV